MDLVDSDEETETMIKAILLGPSAVGKSTIFEQLQNDQMGGLQPVGVLDPTIGVMCMKMYSSEQRIQLWDTAGQERFKSMTKGYYRDSQILLMCFNLADFGPYHQELFLEYFERFVEEHEGSHTDVEVVVIGTHLDMIASEDDAATQLTFAVTLMAPGLEKLYAEQQHATGCFSFSTSLNEPPYRGMDDLRNFFCQAVDRIEAAFTVKKSVVFKYERALRVNKEITLARDRALQKAEQSKKEAAQARQELIKVRKEMELMRASQNEPEAQTEEESGAGLIVALPKSSPRGKAEDLQERVKNAELLVTQTEEESEASTMLAEVLDVEVENSQKLVLNSAPKEKKSCVAASSLIRVESGDLIPMISVKKGDMVEAFDVDTHTIIFSRVVCVLHCSEFHEAEVFHLEFGDGSHLELTADHYVCLGGVGFVRGEDVMPGSSLTITGATVLSVSSRRTRVAGVITNCGTLIANGAPLSSYIMWNKLSHARMHNLLAPIRLMSSLGVSNKMLEGIIMYITKHLICIK